MRPPRWSSGRRSSLMTREIAVKVTPVENEYNKNLIFLIKIRAIRY